jgi:hypothetical protein
VIALMPKRRPEFKTFTRLACALLLITAVAKLITVSSRSSILELSDPLLGYSNRTMLLLVAAAESAVAASLIVRIPALYKYLCAAWIGGHFLLYRLALALIAPGRPCKCLGTLTDKIRISDKTAGIILTIISIYLLVGGLWLYLREMKIFAGSVEIQPIIKFDSRMKAGNSDKVFNA